MDIYTVCSYTSDCNSTHAVNLDINTTINNTTTKWKLKTGALDYFRGVFVMVWVEAVLIISLNIAVIVIILRYRKRSRLYFLIMHLAIADLVLGVTDALPNAIERSLGYTHNTQVWIAGDVVCKLCKMIGNASAMTSNYILAVTSIDRALVVYKPLLSFRRGFMWQKGIILVCWTISIIANSPMIALSATSNTHNITSCDVLMQYNNNDRIYWWKIIIVLMFVFFFAIPLCIIMISYGILVISIYRRTLTPSSSVYGTKRRMTVAQVFNRGLPRSKVKSIKLTFGIVLGFVVSWSLFFTGMFLVIFANYRQPFVMIVVASYYWNSIANPLLFFVFHRKRLDSHQPSLSSERSPVNTAITNDSQRKHCQQNNDNHVCLLKQCVDKTTVSDIPMCNDEASKKDRHICAESSIANETRHIISVLPEKGYQACDTTSV